MASSIAPWSICADRGSKAHVKANINSKYCFIFDAKLLRKGIEKRAKKRIIF